MPPSCSRRASPLWKVISSNARKQACIYDLEACNKRDCSQRACKQSSWRRCMKVTQRDEGRVGDPNTHLVLLVCRGRWIVTKDEERNQNGDDGVVVLESATLSSRRKKRRRGSENNKKLSDRHHTSRLAPYSPLKLMPNNKNHLHSVSSKRFLQMTKHGAGCEGSVNLTLQKATFESCLVLQAFFFFF
jgi:hypothetical protein